MNFDRKRYGKIVALKARKPAHVDVSPEARIAAAVERVQARKERRPASAEIKALLRKSFEEDTLREKFAEINEEPKDYEE